MLKRTKLVRKAMAFVMMLAMVVGMFAAMGTINAYADGETWIYVNGQSGDDGNDGSSESSAVKTWDKAKALLGSNAGGIYVVGTVDASGNITTKNPGSQSVKRTSDIVMFNVSGEATFANIDVDGEDNEFDSPVIKPAQNAKLNFIAGAKFHNIGYVESASRNEEKAGAGMGVPDNSYGGMVCLVVEGVNILVDGAEFYDNSGKGVFFAPMEGWDMGPTTVNLTMKSGTVTGNKGYFYHNEGSNRANKLIIYNALITNNNASNMGERYSSYKNRTGAVYVCDLGKIEVRSTESAGIFDNTSHDIIYIKNPGAENVEFENISTMLGGGNPNWAHGTVADPIASDPDNHFDVYDASPSEGDKVSANGAAKSIISNNFSTVIDSNGSVYFGKGDEDVPDTPVVPEDGDDEPEEPQQPEEKTIKISKTDMDGAEVAGAEIVVLDSEGNEVDRWTSAKEAHEITVAPGEYTLKEENAPEGYQKVTTEISFTVNDDGTVTVNTAKVDPAGACEYKDGVLYLRDEIEEPDNPDTEKPDKPDTPDNPDTENPDEPDNPDTENPDEPDKPDTEKPDEPDKPDTDKPEEPKTHTIKISKQDMGGEEVPGAEMVLTNVASGKEEKWESNGEPESFQLAAGKYTLKETVAPDGFKCVTTTIEFEVTEDGKVVLGTTTVDNDGKIEVLEGDHIVLSDALEDTPEIPEDEPAKVPTNGDKDKTPDDGVKGAYEKPDKAAEKPEQPQKIANETPEKPTTPPATTTKTSDVPKTGDESDATLWFVIMGLAAIALTGTAIAIKKD